MKRILNVIANLLALIIFSPIVLASSVHTKIDIEDASAHVKQTADSETFEIEIKDSTATVSATTTETGTDFSADVADEEKVEINVSGDYEIENETEIVSANMTDISEDYDVNVTVDDNSETYSGTGVFSGFFEFFHNILFSGWVMFNSIFSRVFKVNVLL